MKKIILSILLSIMVLLFTAAPVLAIADPDTPPSVNAVYVYEFSDGSVGVLVDYYLDYAVLPTETVTQAYMVIFVDTDGTTQLKTVAPYTFNDSGYGYGLAWIKFTATEVTTYGLTSASVGDYRIWLAGNPTLAWAGDPPKTIATIDQWNTTGDMAVLLALRVLYYADQLELDWSLDLIETTALGNRLTSLGESYFENVIPYLRTLAPAAFSAGEQKPSLEDIDYTVEFSGTATGAIIAASPVTLVEGNNTITATGVGTFVITLSQGTGGTITNDTGTITSSPSDIVAGDNTITVTGAGDLTVALEGTDLQSAIDESIDGTGWDLTAAATAFGMTRPMFSGIIWMIVSVLICAGVYGWGRKSNAFGNVGADKTIMALFGVCILGGVLLGFLVAKVAVLLFIGYGAFIGYIIFFRASGGDIGKVVMFMGYMWVVVCLAGGVLQGVVPQASTRLTADITDTDTTITVASTAGFKSPGTLWIGDEKIAYYHTTATTFGGTFWRPTVRGSNDTEAVDHSTGERVRMPETALINNALDYNIALLSDASGLQLFVSIPLALFSIITSFMFLPLAFLGTDMVFITVIWAIIALGLLVSLFVALAGGRRV